ncbi:MAG: hypothetical protein NC254_09495, partial [bacterium]|nr:hypothetical protein [bacterium]
SNKMGNSLLAVRGINHKYIVVGKGIQMGFELNFQNKMIYDSYCDQAHYCYRDFNSMSNRCLIFFVGNSLYFPNEAEVFERMIIHENHFEGMNISESPHVKKYFGRIIWVRDIFKSWYVAGISRECDCIDKVCEQLKLVTTNYEVYTVGGSAGGYMAMICGIKLHAKTIYNLSGQYNLFLDGCTSRGLLQLYQMEENRSRYYDIANMTICDIPILYFYPGECEKDVKQAAYIHARNNKNIYYFCIKSKVHGRTIKGRNLIYILTRPYTKIIKYAKWGKRMGRLAFFAKTAGVLPCAVGVCEEMVLKIKERLYLLKQQMRKEKTK